MVLGGSSPLARGLLATQFPDTTQRGIIPARAGFTLFLRRTVLLHSDHPRSRGVYQVPRGHPPDSAGSSPLARGLRGPGTEVTLCNGIIPARAGFTHGRY